MFYGRLLGLLFIIHRVYRNSPQKHPEIIYIFLIYIYMIWDELMKISQCLHFHNLIILIILNIEIFSLGAVYEAVVIITLSSSG